jgi:hypothetical protein
MIVMTHSHGAFGWEYTSDRGDIHGVCKTLQASREASEHAVRQHLSILQGHPLAPTDVPAHVRHEVLAVANS